MTGGGKMIWGISALVAALAAFALLFASRGVAAQAETPLVTTSWPADAAGQEREFWKIIDATAAAETGGERQLADLRQRLAKLPDADLASFIRVYDRLMVRTYDWGLWGATYVAHGGASDDAFEDFRKWLIAQGRETFEKVAADPDALAEILAAGQDSEATFEEFSYLFADIWTERTGKPITDLPKVADALYPPEPRGEPFDEDPDHLAARYPKLWARFSEEPLQ